MTSLHAPNESATAAARAAVDRMAEYDDPAVIISRVALDQLLEWAADIDASPVHQVPLRGLTFAVKDNIDLKGVPTTAACPSFSQHAAATSATVVRALLGAGALPIAKVNLDQFATGLVGTRSPYGTPRNPVNRDLVPGGSSSGSGVAVASGLADFALGTDTAGSGRVPAAMCGLVGIKPTRGRLSSVGVLPAVRSIDCVSVFARDLGLAAQVIEIAAGFDVRDPFSLHEPSEAVGQPRGIAVLGVLADQVLRDIGTDDVIRVAYHTLLEQLGDRGFDLRDIDPTPLFDIGNQLYGGAWVAERVTGLGPFAERLTEPDLFDPVVGAILSTAQSYSVSDVHKSMYTLASQMHAVHQLFADVDALAFPTVAIFPTLREVADDPMGVNTKLGRLTTFTNLANLATVTLPIGAPLSSGAAVLPPFSLTLQAPAWSDAALVEAATRLAGTPARPGPAPTPAPTATATAEPSGETGAGRPRIRLAVAGAHLRGLPLEHQLVDRGARWVETTSTAPVYRMYALAESNPPKPALVHCGPSGAAMEVDVWALDDESFGSFVALVPAPLCIGKVELSDGTIVPGFVSEPRAIDGATDITHFGGWRAYIESTTR